MFSELRERLVDLVGGLFKGGGLGAGAFDPRGGTAGSVNGLVALVTPKAAEGRGPLLQAVMAGGTLAALGAAGAIAATAIGWLMAALAAIYFILTKVLGLKLELDPQAFTRAAYGAN